MQNKLGRSQNASTAVVAIVACCSALACASVASAQATQAPAGVEKRGFAGHGVACTTPNPGPHSQKVTVKNSAGLVAHLTVWENGQTWTCGMSSGPPQVMGTTVLNNKTLDLGQSWSMTYDSTANWLSMSLYVDGPKSPYCFERESLNGGPSDITITVNGTLFKWNCSGGNFVN